MKVDFGQEITTVIQTLDSVSLIALVAVVGLIYIAGKAINANKHN